MVRLEAWTPKDCIAAVTLAFCLFLMSQGIDHVVSGIIIMITTYYFRKRVEDGEVTQCKKRQNSQSKTKGA